MNIDRSYFNQLIKEFNFKNLFNEHGWDNVKINQNIVLKDEEFLLNGIAEKKGFVVLTCSANKDGKIPDVNSRKKIDRIITKYYFEHLVIYSDKDKSTQIWQLSVKEQNKPVQYREYTYYKHQEPELLFQKLRGMVFTLDEEEKIGLVDVRQRVTDQFEQNSEKVTKAFYTRFKTEHSNFQKFIQGIDDKVDIDWYTSLMLNRLMFIYFIQKKGFLDDNLNYLREKLDFTVKRKGKDKFYKSFYRDFLLVLFHKGLGKPEHSPEIIKEIGKVPYLNGGLFDVHRIEKDYDKLDISDKAFQKLFDFFDQYNWHLDTRITATGKDINPDVIGYIFEKYINDRASMGAYYTKEDITEYISKNTIIPFLFDRVKKDCANAFKEESSLWQMLRENPDRYIYDAVKHGVYQESHSDPDLSGEESQFKIRELPDEIAIGVDTTKPDLLERRKEWNKSAPEEFALPTEIWREVVERRNRYFVIKAKLEKDELREINDFITYNLNIRQFAQDAVEKYEGSDFVNAFYKAITEITILDPTCGSGAFLFAALNILEPLYEACIDRMKEFVEEDDEKGGRKRFDNFRKVLSDIEHHPNQKYYIFKSIILKNLYGVDIMNEAVEIAKLRLFLKLVAEVEPDENDENYGLEPLPDIDFNIRTGNTLIGFATKEELNKGLNWSFDFENDKKKIYDEIDVVSKAYKLYKEIQLDGENNYKGFKKAKDELNERLEKLNKSLNEYLANDYGKNRKNKNDFIAWLTEYKPFHWFAEYFEIIEKGGFNILLGNPPYVSFSKINYELSKSNYQCINCKDLFAITIERSFNLIVKNGRNGFIIPLSALSTDTMEDLRNLVFTHTKFSWNSYYSASDQPSSLFSGVRHRLLITLNQVFFGGQGKKYSTNFIKWFSGERKYLFTKFIQYVALNNAVPLNSKISSDLELNLLTKIFTNKRLNNYVRKQGDILYYHNAPVHWGKVFDFVPYYTIGNKKQQSSHLKSLNFEKEIFRDIVIGLLSSSLFYWYNWQFSNCRDLSLKDIYRMHLSLEKIDAKKSTELSKLKTNLMKDLNKNRKLYSRYSNGIQTKFDAYYPMYSKEIIDQIDKVFGDHFMFTEEELDFIINYDIKYRMGKELEED